MKLKRGIEQTVVVVTDSISKLSKQVKGRTEIAQVATVSANGDKNVGSIIADAMEKVGKDGVITVRKEEAWKPSLTWLRECSLTGDT